MLRSLVGSEMCIRDSFKFPSCSDWGAMELPLTALKPFDQDFSKHARIAERDNNLKLGLGEALIAFRDQHRISNHKEMAQRLGVNQELFDEHVSLLAANGWPAEKRPSPVAMAAPPKNTAPPKNRSAPRPKKKKRTTVNPDSPEYLFHSLHFLKFFKFLHERQLMWIAHKRGVRPAVDPDMRCWSLCNVYREMDRGTRFLQHSIRQHTKCCSDKERERVFVWVIMCFRLVNSVEIFHDWFHQRDKYKSLFSVAELGWSPIAYRPQSQIPTIREFPGFVQFLKDKVDTRAEFSAYGMLMEEVRCGLPMLVDQLLSAACRGKRGTLNLKAMFDVFMTLKGVKPFFAWQSCCDLAESRIVAHVGRGGTCSPREEIPWCLLGPSAKEGLALVFDLKLEELEELSEGRQIAKAQLLVEMQEDAFRKLGVEFYKFCGWPINLRNMEHSLAGYHKWVTRDLPKFASRASLDLRKECGKEKCMSQPMHNESPLLTCDLCDASWHMHCLEMDEVPEYEWLCPWCTYRVSDNMRNLDMFDPP
eukprot:TRINITY_DN8030_c0_g1_i4.p1 TRINITY_DN8030_c0_g1~~TRINITY_DN8030_c0_g1_i4.p1  ORF type:complete len:576 (+),score=103.40 TRINITY_DN8030_c0_g1_i4:133-1728(+)